MRRLVVTFAALSAAAFASSMPACSNSSSTASGGDAGDGGIAPLQLVGQPCDPTLSNPCLQGNPCDVFTCDITQQPPVCAATPLGGPCGTEVGEGGFDFDGGGGEDVVTVGFGCQTSSQCPIIGDGSTLAYVCAFSAFDGCSTSGVCVIPEPPHTIDGAVQTACGCNGESVPYVTDDDTQYPVQSPYPCPPPDAGTETGPDGSSDAAPDAPFDAPFDAPADAPFDAAADAPADASGD